MVLPADLHNLALALHMERFRAFLEECAEHYLPW